MKPIVIFTNFWDADYLIKSKEMVLDIDGSPKRVPLITEGATSTLYSYAVYSIALSHPDLNKLPSLALYLENNANRLDFFLPTYDMLKKYHQDKDWEDYTKNYMNILKTNRDKIKLWIRDLHSDCTYFLCCWENTSGQAHCHRQLIYDAISRSSAFKDSHIFIYRTGAKEAKSV